MDVQQQQHAAVMQSYRRQKAEIMQTAARDASAAQSAGAELTHTTESSEWHLKQIQAAEQNTAKREAIVSGFPGSAVELVTMETPLHAQIHRLRAEKTALDATLFHLERSWSPALPADDVRVFLKVLRKNTFNVGKKWFRAEALLRKAEAAAKLSPAEHPPVALRFPCTACGYSERSTALFCTNCGSKMRLTSATLPSAAASGGGGAAVSSAALGAQHQALPPLPPPPRGHRGGGTRSAIHPASAVPLGQDDGWVDVNRPSGKAPAPTRRPVYVVYTIYVTTSAVKHSGTDANIEIELFGASGVSSGMLELKKEGAKHKDLFESGNTDTFEFQLLDLGALTRIVLRADTRKGSGFSFFHHRGNPEWNCDNVRVAASSAGQLAVSASTTGHLWTFPVHSWLGQKKGMSLEASFSVQ